MHSPQGSNIANSHMCVHTSCRGWSCGGELLLQLFQSHTAVVPCLLILCDAYSSLCHAYSSSVMLTHPSVKLTRLMSCWLVCVLQSSSTTSKVSSCTTGANGSCDLKYNDLTTRFANMGYSLSAVVTAAGEGPLVIPAIPSPGSSMAAAQYQGILVLDRKLIKQGDKLHVTGRGGWCRQ